MNYSMNTSELTFPSQIYSSIFSYWTGAITQWMYLHLPPEPQTWKLFLGIFPFSYSSYPIAHYALLLISVAGTSTLAIQISHINYYNYSTCFLSSFLNISNLFQFTSTAISNIVCMCMHGTHSTEVN